MDSNAFVYSSPVLFLSIQWNLICGLSYLPSLSQSIYFVGFLLGSWFSGLLADKFGRWNVCIYLTVLMPPVALVSGLAPSYSIYAFSRFMMGVCAPGSLSFYVLFMETVGLKYRSLVITLSSATFGVGYLFLAVAAYFIPHWRQLTVFTAAITLVMVPFICRWVLTV